MMLDKHKKDRITNDQILKERQLKKIEDEFKAEHEEYISVLPVLNEVKRLLDKDSVVASLRDDGVYESKTLYCSRLGAKSCRFKFNGFLVEYNSKKLMIKISVCESDESTAESIIGRLLSFKILQILVVLWSAYFISIAVSSTLQDMLLMLRVPLFLMISTFAYTVLFVIDIIFGLESNKPLRDYTGK